MKLKEIVLEKSILSASNSNTPVHIKKKVNFSATALVKLFCVLCLIYPHSAFGNDKTNIVNFYYNNQLKFSSILSKWGVLNVEKLIYAFPY